MINGVCVSVNSDVPSALRAFIHQLVMNLYDLVLSHLVKEENESLMISKPASDNQARFSVSIITKSNLLITNGLFTSALSHSGSRSR